MSKILLVEDNDTLCLTIESFLITEHHVVDVVQTGTEGLERVLHYPYDVIILDWDLPGVAGVEICRQFRANGGATPVLILTGKNRVSEVEQGFDSGADDYLTKPFDLRVLAARLRALLRRPSLVKSSVFTHDDLSVDMTNAKVTRGGVEIHLLPKEFALLEFLIRHAEQAFTADVLVQRVWPTESEFSAEGIRPHINRLRAKIDAPNSPSLIQTIRGRGYMFSTKSPSV